MAFYFSVSFYDENCKHWTEHFSIFSISLVPFSDDSFRIERAWTKSNRMDIDMTRVIVGPKTKLENYFLRE